MNRQKISKFLVIMFAGIIGISSLVQAQTPLEQMVSEGDADWMFGRWVAQSDEGEITLVYRWTLEKNMIAVYFRMGDYSYQGMIYCVPGQEQVIEVGVDSKGSVTKSRWDVNWEGLVSIRTTSKTDSGTEELGLLSSKVNDNTMTMKLYGVEWGSLKSDPWETLEFKRQPMQRRGQSRARNNVSN